jgi:oxygen-independent coproporphyrinogen-3 oxidase
MNHDESQRRFLLQSLLQSSGLDLVPFEQRFGNRVTDTFPELNWLIESGYVRRSEGRLILTSVGMEQSDAIAPMLYSPRVRHALEHFTPV